MYSRPDIALLGSRVFEKKLPTAIARILLTQLLPSMSVRMHTNSLIFFEVVRGNYTKRVITERNFTELQEYVFIVRFVLKHSYMANIEVQNCTSRSLHIAAVKYRR